MSAVVRIQFKSRPNPTMLGQLIALASMDDEFQDFDILEDED